MQQKFKQTIMAGIVTLTFAPCIDKTTSVPALLPDKKLKCSSPVVHPGGGGINVARAVIKLGGAATAVYPSGGYTGHAFNRLLKEEGVSAIAIEASRETRENIVVLDESTRLQYRFGMPAVKLSDTECNKLLDSIDRLNDIRFIVVSGSSAPGLPTDIYTQIADMAKRKKARLVADTAGAALERIAEAGVYLLKPNLGELASLAGKEHLHIQDIGDTAQQMIKRYRCEVIIVSMGESGAMLVTDNLIQTITPPSVKRNSTVGAGDSMVAGVVVSLFKGLSLEEATRYGVACGTAATLNPGTGLCNKEDVDRLFDLIKNPPVQTHIL